MICPGSVGFTASGMAIADVSFIMASLLGLGSIAGTVGAGCATGAGSAGAGAAVSSLPPAQDATVSASTASAAITSFSIPLLRFPRFLTLGPVS